MNNEYNYKVGKILKNAEKEMLDLYHPYVGTEHLLLSLLKLSSIENITSKYGLTYDKFKNSLLDIVGSASKKSEVVLYTPLLRIVLDDALTISKNDKEELNEFHLMNALLTSDDGIAIRVLLLMHVDLDALFNEIASSKSKTLESIGNNLNEKKKEILIGRDEEIKNIIEILLRKIKNNPLLIGEAGVGKSAIVYELARRIKNNLVPDKLKGYQIISIDMSSLLSNTKYRGEFESRINTIINEIKARGNIILFIDEIHTLIKSGGGESSIDAANILKPYLASDELKIIGATTISEYEHSIARDKALSRRFRIVNINEPNLEETTNILKGVKSLYEDYHKVSISNENINDIINLTNKYINNHHNPDKSLDVLDYVCSRVSLNNYKYNNEFTCNEYLKNKDYKNALRIKKEMRLNKNRNIKKEDILSVIESICGIKILNMDNYLNLCNELDTKIFGQDLTKLKKILKRKVLYNKVLGITLNGEEGLGKRYTSTLIANTLNYNYLELDMLEYTSSTSINRIVGSDPGYIGYDDDKILDKIKYHPYSLIFLDHFEYAAKNIKNLFKSIIKNGYLIDNKSEKIDFNNTIIIMSTNVSKNSIGYINEIDQSDSIINYELIDKSCLEKYDKYKDIISMLSKKTTFKEINQLIDDMVLNT